jgi:SAM-dependent methyltransferase
MDDDGSQYDTAAANTYLQTEQTPLRQYAEFPVFLEQLGVLLNSSVLDLACGTGILTRLLVREGAARVVGIDASTAMTDEARKGGSDGGRIEYFVHDVATMPHIGSFDAVTAGWLLNYAATREELVALCRRAAEHLASGGRFVTTTTNSDYDMTRPYDERYGVTVDIPEGTSDGGLYSAMFHLDRPLTIQSHYWKIGTYRAALEEAGFGDVTVHPWWPNAEGVQRLGEEFWRPWMDNPSALVLAATKG